MVSDVDRWGNKGLDFAKGYMYSSTGENGLGMGFCGSSRERVFGVEKLWGIVMMDVWCCGGRSSGISSVEGLCGFVGGILVDWRRMRATIGL